MGRCIRRVRRGLAEPHLLARECNKLYYRLRRSSEPTVDVMEEDWDTLCLLDACRYDVFSDRHSLPGNLEARTIDSSATVEFLRTYVDGVDLTDTVYVTANPQLRRHRDELDVRFHEVVDVWESAAWDERRSTVPPEPVVTAAIEALDRHPNKRLVVHFMQPHHPYIGSTGLTELQLESIGHFWTRIRTGELDIDPSTIRRAYVENLDVVLEAVDRLIAEIEGKTVVTADHGEMFGERGGPIPIAEYGHPRGIHTSELVTVPWLTVQNGPRRTVTPGETSVGTSGEADETVRRRLRDLGYA